MGLKILELFGGVGAPRRALLNLGIDVKSIDYVEIDEKAVKSYNSMFDNNYTTQNIVGWDLKPDILIHGSPCQDVSIAGKRAGADKNSGTRSSLMWETLRIVEQLGEWKPKAIVWENVPGILHRGINKNFKAYIDALDAMGYKTSYKVLNALDFGLPQRRERVFTVSTLKGTFDFTNCEIKRNHIKDYLGEFEERHLVKQPSMLSKIVKKRNGSQIGVEIIQDICGTITTRQMRAPNAGVIDLGDGQYRYLTERECWLLQGFKEEDYLAALKANPTKAGCHNTALYKQAGNSMPVPILEHIFKRLI